METYLIVYGNLVDGFTFVGPFESIEAASSYAERDQGQWSIVPVYAPDRT